MENNYYKVLNLNHQRATDKDIRQAYKKLALKFHPDKNKNVGTEEKFKLILEAHNVLMDPVERAKFDRKLKDYSQCSKCSAIFANSNDLTKHYEKYHPKQFKCNYCASIAYFETSQELIKHVSKFHQFKCDMCPTFFVEIKDLSLHKNKFHSVPIECSSCKSKFGKLEELTKHAKLCSKFKCSLCPTKSFKSFEGLNEHKKAKRHFECSVCKSKFGQLEELTKHAELCSQFKCSLCPTSNFKSFQALEQHKKAKHKEAKKHSAIFGCKYCVNSFASLDDLNNHITSIHHYYVTRKHVFWFEDEDFF
jgi:hypothetical protein